jgi:hypothetical protein
VSVRQLLLFLAALQDLYLSNSARTKGGLG